MIDTKALRSRVLELAIQGKLTEQLASDGTAEELYQQIQAEKQALIKEGKIKKEKPLPPVSPEEVPFEIPENWMWVRLQEIVTLLGDGIHGTPKYDENGEYYFINGNNLCNGVIEIKPNTKRIDYDEFLKNKKELNDNTVLVSINGTLGNLAFYNNEKVILGKSACYFNLVKKEMKVYIYYLLKTDYFLKYANYTATGVTIRNVSLKAMNELLLPLPPLAEQKRIVQRVEEIFRILDTIDKAQEKYAEDAQILKAKLITAGIQGKLTEQLDSDGTAEELYQQIQAEKQKLIKEGKLKKEKPLPDISDEEIPFEIPGNWKWVRLGSLLHGVTDGPHYSPKYIDSGIPFISTRNIANGKLDFSSAKYISPELHEELCKRCKPKKGDVLYSKGGTTGIAVVNDSDIEFNVWVHVAVLSMGANVNPYYLAMALNSPHCYGQSQEYTKGTANRDLGLTRMVKITLPLPPLAEQKRIAEVLERAMGAIDRL